MLTALIAIIFWCFCLPMLYLLGELIGFRLSSRGKIIEGVFFIALGWAGFAYFLVILGLFKSLTLMPVIGFMLAILFFRRKGLRNFIGWMKEVASFFDLRISIGSWGWYVRFAFLFSILLTFVFCMLPETSNDGLVYQLTMPKIFLQQSSIAPIEYEVRSYRSFLQNVLYTVGLMLANVPISKLFHWITGVLLVLAVADVIRQKTGDKDLGSFFGALLWFTPTLINQITTTYVDVGVALFVFLSVYLLIGNNRSRKGDIFYSGLLMGVAISIKFFAAIACVSALAYFLWRVFKNRFEKKECLGLMIFGGGIFIGCGFWFIRNAILTGNPVFPYLAKWFTKDVSLIMYPWQPDHRLEGLPRTWTNYVLILWKLTFQPIDFDYHHWIGPAYLVLLPFAIYGVWKVRENLPYLFFTWSMLTMWFYTALVSRYLMPVFPFYLICAACGISFFQHQFHKRELHLMVRSISTALIVFLFALSVYHFRIQFLPIFRIWSVERYLEYTERTAGIAKWVNENLPPNSKVLVHGEVRLFYFDRRAVFEEFFSVFTKYGKDRSPAEIAAFLKAMGFTHLLDGKISRTGPEFTRKREIDLLIQDSSLVRKLYTMVSKNEREPKSIYSVYELV